MSIQSDFKTETSQDNNYNPPHLPLSKRHLLSFQGEEYSLSRVEKGRCPGSPMQAQPPNIITSPGRQPLHAQVTPGLLTRVCGANARYCPGCSSVCHQWSVSLV